jgi:hypothetical protein
VKGFVHKVGIEGEGNGGGQAKEAVGEFCDLRGVKKVRLVTKSYYYIGSIKNSNN